MSRRPAARQNPSRRFSCPPHVRDDRHSFWIKKQPKSPGAGCNGPKRAAGTRRARRSEANVVKLLQSRANWVSCRVLHCCSVDPRLLKSGYHQVATGSQTTRQIRVVPISDSCTAADSPVRRSCADKLTTSRRFPVCPRRPTQTRPADTSIARANWRRPFSMSAAAAGP